MGLAQLKAGKTQLAINAFTKAVAFVPTGLSSPLRRLALASGK